MPSWVFLVIGLAVVSGFALALRKWGKLSAENKQLKATIKAGQRRKEIDYETEKLSSDELLDRIRGSGV